MRSPLDVALDRFGAHDAFERRGDRTFDQVTTPFDATATVVALDGGVQVRISVALDSLDAAATDAVPEVVESGWFETFERRVADATTVTGDDANPTPELTRGTETVTVEVAIETGSDRAPDDAKAVVDFVEATWIQGLVPGYEYEDPADALLGRARGRR